jgi:hypothetical protein
MRLALAFGVALLFTVSMGWFGEVISSNEATINQLYLETEIIAEIRLENPSLGHDNFPLRNNIFQRTIRAMMELEIVAGAELLAGCHRQWLIASPPDGEVLPDSIWLGIRRFDGSELTFIYGTNDIGQLLYRNRYDTARDTPGTYVRFFNNPGDEHGLFPTPHDFGIFALEIDYAEGFEISDFRWDNRFGWRISPTGLTFAEEVENAIPVVAPQDLLDIRGIKPGDIAYLVHSFSNSVQQWAFPVRIIGVHNGYFFDGNMWESVIMPLEALEVIRGEELGYIQAQFIIDNTRNRELDYFREEMNDIVQRSSAGALPLILLVFDEELRATLQPLEQLQGIFHMLYPISLIITGLIAFGISAFLTLKNAKSAAILRSFGVSKKQVRLALGGELLFISIVGVSMGLLVFAPFVCGLSGSLSINIQALQGAVIYVFGTLCGAAISGVAVTDKAPLSLLQVKE